MSHTWKWVARAADLHSVLMAVFGANSVLLAARGVSKLLAGTVLPWWIDIIIASALAGCFVLFARMRRGRIPDPIESHSAVTSRAQLEKAPKLWVNYKRGQAPKEELLVFAKDGKSTIVNIQVGPLNWVVEKRKQHPIELLNVIGPLREEPIECRFWPSVVKNRIQIGYDLPGLYRDMMRELDAEVQPSVEISYDDEDGNHFCRTFVLSIDIYDRIVWDPGPIRLRDS